MSDMPTTPTSAATASHSPLAYWDEMLEKTTQMMRQYWDQNPDLKRFIDKKRQQAEAVASMPRKTLTETQSVEANITKPEPISLVDTTPRGQALRGLIRENQSKIRERVSDHGASVMPRTQAHNRKCQHESIDDACTFREELLAAQIKSWRSMLPNLIRRFSKIPDHRRLESVKHKMTVLMVFGLFAFIFRLNSRREMNRELTGPLIFEHLRALFPDIDTIPHADTLGRVLQDINPERLEAIHVNLVKDLIKKKKFRKMLIEGCIPITIDGSQKLCRDGLLQDGGWCERRVGRPEAGNKQQYIYVLEANLTLKSGLTIPLMSEFLYRSNNTIEQDSGKQDCETTAFERLAARLKGYFPRLRILMMADAMFATQPVMTIMRKNHWEYIIRLPKRKLRDFAKQLNARKPFSQSIPNQHHYRKRKQSFYWENDIIYGYELDLNINLIACFEEYEEVNKKTGGTEKRFSEHTWISSIPAKIDNLHELLNCGARKAELIEDSFNTAKNRGYQYTHAFSHKWNGMRGFHYLMRLAHAINAISEFTKVLKRYIKELGVSATLKLIKSTLFNPWLSIEWYANQNLEPPQLCLQLE